MSQQKKDYYKILGLTKGAESEQIKKAYKKLAIKWHPDKNPGREKEAEEKFKDIAEAYAVLSNERKRRQYDLHGTVDFDSERESSSADHFGFGDFGFASRSGGFEEFTFERAENLFKDVFGDEFEQYGFGRHHRNQRFEDNNQNFNNRRQQGFGDDFMMGRGFGNFFTDFGFGDFGFGGRNQDFMANNFFGNFGMGGMNMNFASMSSNMSSSMGGFGGTSQSVSTSTIIRNGKEVTVTKTTITNPDGTSHTEVQERVADGGRTISNNRYVGQGQNPRLENVNKQIGYEKGAKVQK